MAAKKKFLKVKNIILLAVVAALVLSMLFLTVDEESSAGITRLSDLEGRNVGVQSGCLYEENLLAAVPKANVQFFSDPNTMILALEQGKLDAMITESTSFGVIKGIHKGLAPLEENIGIIRNCCVFGDTARDAQILAEYNEFLKQSAKDGLSDELYSYWVENYDSEACTVDMSGITGEKGKLVVAVESGYEPFSFVKEGVLVGYDIDMIYRFARAYGYEPEFLSLTFDAIAPAVASGKANLGTGIIVNEERKDSAILSDPYINLSLLVIINTDYADSEGFFEGIANSFQKTFIKEGRYKLFLQGSQTTLIICGLSIIIGSVLGFALYLYCRDGSKIPGKIMDTISWIIHGIPSILLLMIMAYIVLAKTILSGIAVAVVGFSAVFACSVYDMISNGVRAVGKGQEEAARAQGFSSTRAFFKVVFPQAAYHFMPNYKAEVVSLLKESSVVGYIAVTDLTKMSDIVRSRTYEAFFPLITTALIYFIFIFVLTELLSLFDPLIDIKKRKPGRALRDVLDK